MITTIQANYVLLFDITERSPNFLMEETAILKRVADREYTENDMNQNDKNFTQSD